MKKLIMTITTLILLNGTSFGVKRYTGDRFGSKDTSGVNSKQLHTQGFGGGNGNLETMKAEANDIFFKFKSNIHNISENLTKEKEYIELYLQDFIDLLSRNEDNTIETVKNEVKDKFNDLKDKITTSLHTGASKLEAIELELNNLFHQEDKIQVHDGENLKAYFKDTFKHFSSKAKRKLQDVAWRLDMIKLTLSDLMNELSKSENDNENIKIEVMSILNDFNLKVKNIHDYVISEVTTIASDLLHVMNKL